MKAAAGAVALLALAAAAMTLAGDGTSSSAPSDGAISGPALRRLLSMRRPTAPAPDPTNRWADDPAAAALGQRLFFEPRLSRNGAVSCATCHDPAKGFTDGRRRAVGLAEGTRNTQGLLDIADLPWFTWDGRADSLWSQALHPFEDDREMGISRVELIERVRLIEPLRAEYERLFGPLPPTTRPGAAAVPPPTTPAAPPGAEADPAALAVDRAFANLGKAIAAYERRLRTGPSPFDRALERLERGDAAAIEGFGEPERRGMLLFVDRADCWRCHHGPLLSDGSFHSIGVPLLDGGIPHDRGRLDAIARLQASPFNAAGPFSDDSSGSKAALTRSLAADPMLWGAVRTPSLRNAARTAPYMHEGQFASLEEVVRFYSTLEGALTDHHGERVLEPLGLSDREIADLAAFLRSLDGSLPDPELLRAPRE